MKGEQVDRKDMGEDIIPANRYGGLTVRTNLDTCSGCVITVSMAASSIVLMFSIETSEIRVGG